MNARDLYKILGANIKLQRSRANWSQEELADRLAISVPFLSSIETGRKWVSSGTLLKLANIFRVEAYELLKPDTVLPDTYRNLLEKYTEDVALAVGKVRRRYLAGLRRR
ncbi:MAG: helix-turn-helix domain-containing protein [Candidatus Margulisbacteria bacterium]|jgi:transcriptional regulator with XRE-family HTH domain|nr:helix-turn-helix domain-containing protein [Candidatus Margulisiibacteriota bacterium]